MTMLEATGMTDQAAEAIAASRSPDDVTWTDWEDDPDAPTGETRTVSWPLPWPFPRQHRQEVLRRQRRKRIERWVRPEKVISRITDTAPGEIVVIAERVERATVMRFEWEYRSSWVPK